MKRHVGYLLQHVAVAEHAGGTALVDVDRRRDEADTHVRGVCRQAVDDVERRLFEHFVAGFRYAGAAVEHEDQVETAVGSRH